MLESYHLHPSDIIITGDFNIWVDLPDLSKPKQFLDLLSSFNLTQHIHEPTHRSLHTLDLLITRDCEDTVSDVSVEPGFSDHSLIICRLNLCKPPRIRKIINTRRYKAIDLGVFSNDVKQSLSKIDFVDCDVSSCVARYESSLKDLLDTHAPSKSRSVVLRTNSPWFNDNIRDAKTLRRKLERKWRRSKLQIDREIYCIQKQAVINLIRKAKINHYSELIAGCAGDQKKLFNIIANLLGKNNVPVLPDARSDLALANSFSAFFVGKIDKIRQGFDMTNSNVTSSQTAAYNPILVNMESFEPTTEDEVKKVLMKAPTKSCELDPIPTWLIKKCLDAFIPFITCIVNKSLEDGIFPQNLKLAYIRPLLKKAGLDKEQLKNYRPVANLKFIGKIIERIVSTRIQAHISRYNLHDPFQSAYRTNHSIETALLRVNNDLLCDMDKGKVSALLLLDLSAAFDTVDHKILISRLNDIGICGSALNWCRSYLDNRSQCVRIGDESSNPVRLNYSVPQGSVLGPQWFVLYTTPVQDIIKKYNIRYHYYADDLQLYVSFNPDSKSANASISTLQECVSEIREWMKCNFLKLNDDKTEFMLIGSRQQLDKISVKSVQIGDSLVQPVQKVRNLGVMMDSSLTLHSHVSSIVKSSSYHIRNLGRIRKYLTPKATEQLVHAFITSRLDMGNALLFGLPQQEIKRLQIRQNIAARIVTRTKPREHISPVLVDLHWLPVHFRIRYKILLLTYRALNGQSPTYISDLITVHTATRQGLRSAGQTLLSTPRFNRSWGDRSFANSAPHLWNSLPENIKSSTSLDSFKRLVKTHLMTSFISTL